jgi:tRNA(Ile)-lysidine synthase
MNLNQEREWAGTAELAVRAAVRTALADLAPSALVLVACSGGPDSTALAAAAAAEGPRAGLRVGAVVVDHQLQEASGAVAAATSRWLRTAGLDPVEVVPVTVSGAGGPEDAARRARYAALEAAAERFGAAAVLLGHTRDDQAETVLLGLGRGSGARSLAGMASRRGRYRRPLLALPRATVHQALPESAPVWTDPHNADPAYRRVRVREEVLPVLEAALGPGVSAALARTADLLRADADALTELADRAYADLGADPTALDLAALADLPAAVRSRVLRTAAIAAGAPPGALRAEHIAALADLVTQWRGQGSPALPGGVRAHRGCGRLSLRAE